MIRLVGIFTLGLVLVAAPSFAEESATPADPAGVDVGSEAAPAADPVPALPLESEAVSAPAAPAPVAPPVLKPITITFSGEVASVAAAENPPMITIQDRYGVKKEISVPSEAKVTAGTASKALADLKGGDKVTVEYTYDVATGKRTAQTITVGEAATAGS
ncbi:MAG: hypothetical protein Q7J69_02310 [Candidatus Omnitrophota bacterium]|nr:hypothetical protein [Candidatus Omnitrophota bacterium]